MRRLFYSAIATFATGSVALAGNPGAFFFNTTYAHIQDYKHPTAMLITGQCNRDVQHFKDARAAGAEVLAYIDPIEMLDDSTPCETYRQLYGTPAAWPYLDSAGKPRSNWTGYHLIDITKGSAWSNRLIAYVEQLMRDDDVDGVFLDALGAQLWDNAKDEGAHYKYWTQAEQDRWTDGAVDLVKRLDESRRAINPRFIIINNGHWERANDTRGVVAEQYVDGVCLEQKTYLNNQYYQNYAARPFGNLGHRRVLVITRDENDARDWNADPQVTHVGWQDSADSGYGSPSNPTIPTPTRLPDRPKKFGRVTIAANPSVYMGADRKRASKFTLTDTGHLTELYAYIDGQGGASGSQQLQMDLYRDNNGVPDQKVAASSIRSFDDTATPQWRNFAVSGLPLLVPGDYWITIHSGAIGGVTRNYVDSVAPYTPDNWFTNVDTFSDGATSTFGAGNTGTSGTLSVFAKYLVGQ
jgi:hypothetical protein